MGSELSTYLSGKTGRIYIARRGTITVYLLANGESWFASNACPSVAIFKGPVPQYWQSSIDFAGGFSDYFTTGMILDETDSPFYPPANPLNAITDAMMEKLKTRHQ